MTPESKATLIHVLRELRLGMDALPKTVIRGDKMRLFRLVVDREIGRAKYNVEVWGVRTALGKLPMTRGATQAARDGRISDLTVEHTVPVGVLYAAFALAHSDLEYQAIIDHYHVALVTKDEDRALRNSFVGAGSKMPAGWALGHDCLARYINAGIELDHTQVDRAADAQR